MLAVIQDHLWFWRRNPAARSLWETKHYREAVQAAATSVNAHLQQLTGRRDVHDTDLVTQTFSEKDPEPGKPRLRWPGAPSDVEYKTMQAGLLALDRLGVFGPNHPHTLAARGGLAYWRGEAGDAAGAAAAFEQLLTDRVRVLGPDHPDTQTTRHNLAQWRARAKRCPTPWVDQPAEPSWLRSASREDQVS